jgi:hypothetical protein
MTNVYGVVIYEEDKDPHWLRGDNGFIFYTEYLGVAQIQAQVTKDSFWWPDPSKVEVRVEKIVDKEE